MALASSSSITYGAKLHQSTDQLLNDATRPLHLLEHRSGFQDVMRKVDMNSYDAYSPLALDPANPSVIQEELEIQKEKYYRFKVPYLEQAAKRDFLYAISGTEPQGVQREECELLEQSNKERKAVIEGMKARVEEMQRGHVQRSTSNAQKHAALAPKLDQVRSLKSQIRDIEVELARIKATHPPEQRLTLDQAEQRLSFQDAEIVRLSEIRDQEKIDADAAASEMARTAKEVQRLSRERDREEARAREVREGREAGDTKVDEMCNWLASSIAFYKALLGIRSVRAVSDNILHLEYDSVILALSYDAVTKRLAQAELIGSELDIMEAASFAVKGNNVPGLIADVLSRLRNEAVA